MEKTMKTQLIILTTLLNISAVATVSDRFDHKGNRIEQRLGNKGDRIEDRYNDRADRAREAG